jgi:exosortase/archaeosortase family protein
MPVDYGAGFYVQTFILFWSFISLFLAVMAYDRSKRYAIGNPRNWGILVLFAGVAGYLWLVYLCRKKGLPETGSKKDKGKVEEKEKAPEKASEDSEKEHERVLVSRKMEIFYISLLILPMIALMFSEEALVNFYMLSIVYFVMVYSIKEEYESLPLVPRQWEVILGALVIASSFAITELKWMVVAGTRSYGMINFGVLLIGVTLSFFGVSSYRITPLKALALGGGAMLVFVALLKFAFIVTVFVVLVVGLVLMAYGLQKVRPVFMPPVIVLTLAFINTGFYQSQEFIDAATKYLAPFVSQFSTWFTSLLGYNNFARASIGSNRWEIVFVGNGFTDGVGVVGNCTGIIGAMFYGVIAIAMLIWVRCEWWRKLAIVLGGIMGSFITNLFRVVTLILVYWHFDYPTPQHSSLKNLLYVHEYLGDILYIIFISIYWFFAFKYLIPVAPAESATQTSKAEKIVFMSTGRRRDARVIKTAAVPGQKRRDIKKMKRRGKYSEAIPDDKAGR